MSALGQGFVPSFYSLSRVGTFRARVRAVRATRLLDFRIKKGTHTRTMNQHCVPGPLRSATCEGGRMQPTAGPRGSRRPLRRHPEPRAACAVEAGQHGVDLALSEGRPFPDRAATFSAAPYLGRRLRGTLGQFSRFKRQRSDSDRQP